MAEGQGMSSLLVMTMKKKMEHSAILGAGLAILAADRCVGKTALPHSIILAPSAKSHHHTEEVPDMCYGTNEYAREESEQDVNRMASCGIQCAEMVLARLVAVFAPKTASTV